MKLRSYPDRADIRRIDQPSMNRQRWVPQHLVWKTGPAFSWEVWRIGTRPYSSFRCSGLTGLHPAGALPQLPVPLAAGRTHCLHSHGKSPAVPQSAGLLCSPHIKGKRAPPSLGREGGADCLLRGVRQGVNQADASSQHRLTIRAMAQIKMAPPLAEDGASPLEANGESPDPLARAAQHGRY